MPQLIDIHGLPLDLEKITAFKLVPREAIFYPAYKETPEMRSSIFARWNAKDKKKFEFVQMVPFGILLTDREKPHIGDYKVESFAEAAGQNIFAGLEKLFSTAGNLIIDALQLDTSGNQSFRILTSGRRVVETRLRDIPAKVQLLSGKIADVYKNDPIYNYLGEPISPTIHRTKALEIQVGRDTYAFFGNNIDLSNEQLEFTYKTLLNAYNEMQQRKDAKLADNKNRPLFQLPQINLQLPKIEFPKIDLSQIRIQSPFVFEEKKDMQPEIKLAENNSQSDLSEEQQSKE